MSKFVSNTITPVGTEATVLLVDRDGACIGGAFNGVFKDGFFVPKTQTHHIKSTGEAFIGYLRAPQALNGKAVVYVKQSVGVQGSFKDGVFEVDTSAPVFIKCKTVEGHHAVPDANGAPFVFDCEDRLVVAGDVLPDSVE